MNKYLFVGFVSFVAGGIVAELSLRRVGLIVPGRRVRNQPPVPAPARGRTSLSPMQAPTARRWDERVDGQTASGRPLNPTDRRRWTFYDPRYRDQENR